MHAQLTQANGAIVMKAFAVSFFFCALCVLIERAIHFFPIAFWPIEIMQRFFHKYFGQRWEKSNVKNNFAFVHRNLHEFFRQFSLFLFQLNGQWSRATDRLCLLPCHFFHSCYYQTNLCTKITTCKPQYEFDFNEILLKITFFMENRTKKKPCTMLLFCRFSAYP